MFHAAISGLSHEVELTTVVDGKPVDRRTGSLLWTHFGISGPVVMDASRFWIINHAAGRKVELLGKLLPGMKLEQVEHWLIAGAAQAPRASLKTMLSERLPERLSVALLRHVCLEPGVAIAQLPRQLRRDLVRCLTMMQLPVIGDRGWNYAEVTAGGVPLSEIDFRTMESRKTPGLHLVGEILDCDGRIGGFNFQWAWSTGNVAGQAIAKSLKG